MTTHLTVVPDGGTYVEPTMREFREVLARYELAPRTIALYVSELRRIEAWCEMQGYSLRNVPGEVLAQYVALRPKSRSTRQHMRAALTRYWRAFERPNPPLWVIRVPRKPRMICRALEPEEAARLSDVARARGDRPGFAVLLGLYMALRRDEIANVAWKDFTDDPGWLKLVGKGNLPARLPLHPVVTEALSKLERSDPHWVFPARKGRNSKGGHANSATVWVWVRKVAEEAGVGEMTTHRLRHTALATACDVTGDLRAVQEFARHASVEVTQGYTRTTERRLRDVLAAIRYEVDGDLTSPGDEVDPDQDPHWHRLRRNWPTLSPAARRVLATTAERIVGGEA